MGRLYIKATGYKYKEYDRRLKRQFINGLDNESIIVEIIKELTALKDTSDMSNKDVLMWAQRSEPQHVQKEVLDNMKNKKEFDLVRSSRQNNNNNSKNRQ